MISQKILLTLLSIFLTATITFAQSFGFGCLGLSGLTVGYTVQEYEAGGLNQYIHDRLAVKESEEVQDLFREGRGYRIGANIVRARIHGGFISIKGFYQFLKEEKSVTLQENDVLSQNQLELRMDYWGVGMDFGVGIFSFLDWKIVDGGISFYKTRLKQKAVYQDGSIVDKKYTLPRTNLGYYVGTGLIIEVVDGYLSLEGSAYYNHTYIEYLEASPGDRIPEQYSKTSLIEKGKFSGTVQLNLGVPL